MAFTSAALPVPEDDDALAYSSPEAFSGSFPGSFSVPSLTVAGATRTPVTPVPSPSRPMPTRASRHAKEVSLVAVGPLEWLTLTAGIAVVLLSFGDFYRFQLDLVGARRTESLTAWSGSYAEIATCVAFGGTVLLAVALLLPALRRSVMLRALVALAFAVALLAAIGPGSTTPPPAATATSLPSPRTVGMR